jgi:hypothetical protein
VLVKLQTNIASDRLKTLFPSPALVSFSTTRPLRVTGVVPARSSLLSDGVAGRRERGCTARVVVSRFRLRIRSRVSIRIWKAFAQVATGAMPLLSLFPAPASGVGDWWTCISWRRKWWTAVGGRFGPRSLNKLTVWFHTGNPRSAHPLICSFHHGGGGKDEGGADCWRSARWGSSENATHGNASSMVFRQRSAVPPSTLLAEWRLL